MTCSSCPGSFLTVFTCEDGNDRCYACKTKHQPVATRLPMVPAPGQPPREGPVAAYNEKRRVDAIKRNSANEAKNLETKRVALKRIKERLEYKITEIKTHMDWEKNSRLSCMVETFEECVRIVSVQGRSD